MRAMNLLPVEERGGARAPGGPSRLTPVHALAGVGTVVVVGLLGTYALAKQDTASAREAEAAAVSRSATAQAQVDRLAPVVAFDARRQARESSVLALAAGRTDWAMVLSATAGALPANVSVTTLKLQAADATGAATGAATAAPAGLSGVGTVTLNVCADTQPRVATTLRRLRALPQVEDVALAQSSRSGAASASGSTGSSSTGGAGCAKVSADAALGLSAATIIDAASASAAAGTTTAPGAAATPAAAAGAPAPSAAPTTTGTSR